MERRDWAVLLACLWLTLGAASRANAETPGGSYATYSPTGPRTLVGAIEPAVRKWYTPQELYYQYGWDQWSYTNYARSLYERYVDITLEGNRHYDIYGEYVTRGWEIYRWEDSQPRDLGSSIYKNPRFASFFNNLLISSTSKGQFFTALTVGNTIRTTLTPLTFSTPAFNGLQWDFASDKYQVTALASRISNPSSARKDDLSPGENVTDYMGLLGFHGTVQLGDFASVGGTYVGARIGKSVDDFVSGSLKGVLTSDQNAQRVLTVTIRISDDSPEDREAGGMLFDERVFIDGREADLGPRNPEVKGGVRRGGRLEANGSDEIYLTYDLSSYSYTDEQGNVRDLNWFKKIGFALVLANDYRVSVTSNRQLDASSKPVFLPVAIAEGNVKDATNQTVIRFDYGLPTGNEIFGASLDITDLLGFRLRGEWDVNRRHRRFPNPNPDIKENTLATSRSPAYYVTVSKQAFPWYGYLEVFSMDPNYSTTAFMPTTAGKVFYSDSQNSWFEFVDDNDDQDRYPDWKRATVNQMAGNEVDLLTGTLGSGVFPGYDENNDFIPDFNQNQNYQPDYVEPFLRYAVDPPEFLFGIDMNNNTVIDRFENDDFADYPYKKDHRGFNVYAGAEVVRGLKVTVGGMRDGLISSARQNRSLYNMVSLDKSFAGIGDLRAFQSTKIAHDNIPDDLLTWVQQAGSYGSSVFTPDPLVAPNTIITSAYADFSYIGLRGSTFVNKIKADLYSQRKAGSGQNEGLEKDARFVGVINKIDHVFERGKVVLSPRLKSTYWYQSSLRKGGAKTHQYSALGSLILNYKAFSTASFQFGYEFNKVVDLVDRKGDSRADAGITENVYGIQFTNNTAYLGYQLTANVGFRAQIQDFVNGITKTNTVTFVKVFAGVER